MNGKDRLTAQEVMVLHAQALFTHDARSRLRVVNEPGGSSVPAPRLFLGRTPAGNVWRFRADLPETLTRELEALCADEPVSAELRSPPRHAEAYVRLLEAHALVQRSSMGPAYRVTELPEPSRPLIVVEEADADRLRGGFDDLVDELPTWQPFIAAVEQGRVVSVCRSARITSAAHEAGVETLPAFRGKGYARDVVAGWARAVQSRGAIPLYSTSWENTASQRLAAKLGLLPFGVDFHVT